MNKKKKLIIGVSSVFVITLLITTLTLTLGSENDNVVYQAEPEIEKQENQAGGFLTLMLETEAGSGEYKESTSGTWPGNDYIFNENMSACENGGELSWDSSTNSVKLLANSSDACYVYFDKKLTLADICNPDENLSECIINYYNATGDMDNGLYYHDADLANGAQDYSYRYAGGNPDNYVCFGDDCSNEDNLYRIIGVFGNEVKLIKSTSYGRYAWESDQNGQGNTWNSSIKPDIYTTLNSTYMGTLSSTWQNKITNHTFKVGGIAQSLETAKEYYDREVGSSSSSTTDTMKIGLMYVSDYGFAANQNAWTSSLRDYDLSNIKNNNWMYLGSMEWTISRFSATLISVFPVSDRGFVSSTVGVSGFCAVRPVFYLKDSVTYVSGDGSKENPIQIDYKQTLAEYVTSQYTGTDGDNGLYYHTSNLANSAADNSYRYAGANPNNYVCFGSGEATCPSDNLYRIIGVFGNQVKLIKSTSYGNYAWESDWQGQGNTWNSSTKPDIRTTLNSTFLGTISSTWQNKIATHTWKVGGMSYSQTNTAKEYYNTEVGSSSSSTTDSMKIGLMYVSDYGFAASSDYWTTGLYNYEPAKSSNWLAGLTEWTISRISDITHDGFRVYSAGYVGRYDVSTSSAVRPVFYLTSDTTYVSGSGTQSDPIRIN